MTEEHKRKIGEGKKRYYQYNPQAKEIDRERTSRLIKLGIIPGFKKGNQLRKGKPAWNKDKKAIDDPRILKHANIIDKITGKPINYKGGNFKCRICGKDLGHRWKSKYCTKCFGLTIRGQNHYNWKGGITPKLQAIRNSQKYKNWRQSIFERDNYTCQGCFRRGYKLNADHIKSFAEYPDLRFELSNGRTLCIDCHKKTSNYAGRKNVIL